MIDLADADCPAVTLLRLHPNTRLPPHSVPVDRTYFVLSGTARVGIGKKWDACRVAHAAGRELLVGSSNTITFDWNEDEVVSEVRIRMTVSSRHPAGTIRSSLAPA